MIVNVKYLECSKLLSERAQGYALQCSNLVAPYFVWDQIGIVLRSSNTS